MKAKAISTTTLVPLTLAMVMGTAMPLTAQAELAGNIGVHSKYLLRGIGLENDNTAVQGGIDYTNESGFYAGWWGSNLGYSYNTGAAPDPDGNGFENDFYAGFAGSMGDMSYKLGVIQYYYLEVDDSDLTEILANVGYGPLTMQMQYLANDGVWGNAGDIYWTVNYTAELPSDFTFGASLGWYTYDDDDNSELCAGAGLAPGCSVTTEDSAFRHLNLTLSHPIADTGANMYIQYTIPGENRAGDDDFDDKIVMGLTYGFDI